MADESHIEQRLSNIEDTLGRLINYLSGQTAESTETKKEINKEDFARLYNTVKYTIPMTSRFSPTFIIINEKYKDSLLKDTLTPSDFAGYYEPIGELSPMLISFNKLKHDYDYTVEFVLEGYFEDDRPQAKAV